MNNRYLFFIAIGLYLIFMTPIIYPWDNKIQALIILVIVQMLWVGRVFALAYTAFIAILLMSLHVFSFESVVGYLGEETVWLIFATFILSGAFMKSGLAERMSLNMLRLSRGNSKMLLLIMFMLITVLAVFIPISVGRAGIVISLIIGVIKSIQKESPIDNLGKAFFIGLNIVVLITGALVVTGSNTAIYAYSIFQKVSDYEWSYLSWVALFVPPIVLYVLLTWILLMWIFPLEKINSEKVMDNIRTEMQSLGTLTLKEVKMFTIILVTVCMWFFESYHGFSISMIGIFGAILTVFPGVGIWSWKDAVQEVEWEFLVFIAANLAMANMLLETGALKWIAQIIINRTSFIQEPWHYLILLSIFTLLLRSIFANVFGFVSVMIPLAIIIGETVGGLPPIIFAMVIYLIGLPGYFFITQGAINLMTYRLGYYNQMEHFKAGIICGFSLIVVVIITAMFYWIRAI